VQRMSSVGAGTRGAIPSVHVQRKSSPTGVATPTRGLGLPPSRNSTLGGGGGIPPWRPSLLLPQSFGTDARMLAICERIDADKNGSISKLELIAAVHRDTEVADLILPGRDSSLLMRDEQSFDDVDAIFDAIAGGKQRIRYDDFVMHFRGGPTQHISNAGELRSLYDLIDADGNGCISKLELVAAVQHQAAVAALVLPGIDGRNVMSDEPTFDAVGSIFEAIACGKRRIGFVDFEAYFRKDAPASPRPHPLLDRTGTRVFIVGPGFGQQLNPLQGALVEQAGFQVHWFFNLPNPELPNFVISPHLEMMRLEIEAFRPDVVVAASKGGIYVVGLLDSGYWRGPTVLINAHPSCKCLPEGVPVVLAHGSNDEVYPTSRADLECLMATGSANKCFLYYTANSGQLTSGQRSRYGDRHNMESLLHHDCLPRLIDATLCPEGPEVHMVRTWRERLSEERLDAEAWLGYSPERLRRHWASPNHRGLDDRKLFEVPRGSEEFHQVSSVFHAVPKEPPAYLLSPQAAWDQVQVLNVHRVENGMQEDGCSKPYYDALRRSLADQGVEFEPGVHTCWAFHGAEAGALESIISNPVAGFQPLISGSRNATLWGLGTYFARDAKYVADGGFCGAIQRDGSRCMLMCLVMMGLPCLGDPQHRGVLPFRLRPHRYHSAVDSLSSPEICVVQHAGAALPAYLITFA